MLEAQKLLIHDDKLFAAWQCIASFEYLSWWPHLVKNPFYFCIDTRWC